MSGGGAPRGLCSPRWRVSSARCWSADSKCFDLRFPGLVHLPPSGMMDRREDPMNGPSNTIDKADEAQLLATIDRWVEREVAPKVKEFDHADRWPAALVEQMKELGLFGATVSPDYGGLGLPARTYAEIVMRVSSVWMALTGIFNSHLMLALAIEKFGTEPQKRRWLPKLASGEVRCR